MSVKVRLAAPGEGSAVHRLADIALAGYTTVSNVEELGAAIDADGGRLRVPYGLAHALVACPDGGPPAGLLYVTPTVDLISNCATDIMPAEKDRLGTLLAEIQLLGVDETARAQGLGTRLLRYAEAMLSQRGCRIVLVKIRREEETVAWYQKRGFRIVEDGEPVVLKVEGMRLGIADKPDDFRFGMKVLQRVGK